MKVYLFDEKSGLYEGEDYWSRDEVCTGEGVTTLAPPITGHGQLPVFDKELGSWRTVSAETMRTAVKRNGR